MKKILLSIFALMASENYGKAVYSMYEKRHMKQNPIVQIAAAELVKKGSLHHFYGHTETQKSNTRRSNTKNMKIHS